MSSTVSAFLRVNTPLSKAYIHSIEGNEHLEIDLKCLSRQYFVNADDTVAQKVNGFYRSSLMYYSLSHFSKVCDFFSMFVCRLLILTQVSSYCRLLFRRTVQGGRIFDVPVLVKRFLLGVEFPPLFLVDF